MSNFEIKRPIQNLVILMEDKEKENLLIELMGKDLFR